MKANTRDFISGSTTGANKIKPDTKWPGTYRQGIPKDDGSDKDNKTKGFFKGHDYLHRKIKSRLYLELGREITRRKEGSAACLVRKEFIGTDGQVHLATKCVFMSGPLTLSARALRFRKPRCWTIDQNLQGIFPPADDTPLPFDL